MSLQLSNNTKIYIFNLFGNHKITFIKFMFEYMVNNKKRKYCSVNLRYNLHGDL